MKKRRIEDKCAKAELSEQNRKSSVTQLTVNKVTQDVVFKQVVVEHSL